MVNDRKIYEKIRDLSATTTSWVKYVDEIGNQCAYTDRCVESILEMARELEELYGVTGVKRK